MTADAILLLHALIVLFNIALVPAIWIGAWRGWRWVRVRLLRMAHLMSMAFIAAEAMLSVTCPLTIWEAALRGDVAEAGFVQHWVKAWLYWDWPWWVFTALYCGWLALIAATWVLVPPKPKGN